MEVGNNGIWAILSNVSHNYLLISPFMYNQMLTLTPYRAKKRTEKTSQ